MDYLGKLVRFFGEPTPMLNKLSKALTTYVTEKEQKEGQTLSDILGTLTKVCVQMINTPALSDRIPDKDNKMLIVRLIVGLIILYDHVHPSGAFAKGSLIDVKGCVKVVQAEEKTVSESLIDALKYTTKHFNDES